MNKLIIGLLIVAAGAGIFFFLRPKKETTSNELHKESIIGKWNPVAMGSHTVMATDSNFSKYRFEFQKGGIIIRSLNDSVKVDTTHYEWNKASELIWKEKATDSTGKIYVVSKLTQDSLQVQSADSSIILFTKLK